MIEGTIDHQLRLSGPSSLARAVSACPELADQTIFSWKIILFHPGPVVVRTGDVVLSGVDYDDRRSHRSPTPSAGLGGWIFGS